MTALDHALRLASGGYKVFFCNSDKEPTTLRGFYDATDDPGMVFDLWSLRPGDLVAIATGEVSGVDVVDIDTKHLSALLWWQLNRDRLTQTRLHATRSGGYHVLFRHRPLMRCSISRIAAGVDVRADFGYVIWWPAAEFSVLSEKSLALWPDWLAVLAEPRNGRVLGSPAHPRKRTSHEVHRGYGAAALQRAIDRILDAPNGRQEAVLNREAFSIGTLIAAGVIGKEPARRALLKVAGEVPSLDPARPWRSGEVSTKITRGLEDGMRHPRVLQR
jgi:Bifunctional DNA primase/polymerase, N-terminal